MYTDYLLEAHDLKTGFTTDEGQALAVNGVSLTVKPGEIVGLVGESGSGKSVTGFSIMRLIEEPVRIVGGQIVYKGQNLLDLTEKQMRQLRGNRIAMIFQDPMMTLNPVLRIDTQMIETLQAHEKISRKEALARCASFGVDGCA